MNYGFWSPELAREETVVVAPACRQAGSLLCDGKVVSELALRWKSSSRALALQNNSSGRVKDLQQ